VLSPVMVRNMHQDLSFSFVYTSLGISLVADRLCAFSNLHLKPGRPAFLLIFVHE
jgi:hypothetical protein